MASVPAAFDPEAMVARFRDRARAVRDRGLPPVEGPERQRFREQAQLDYMDFAIVGDAETTLEGGILTFRVDLRPPDQRDEGDAGPAGGGSPPGDATAG